MAPLLLIILRARSSLCHLRSAQKEIDFLVQEEKRQKITNCSSRNVVRAFPELAKWRNAGDAPRHANKIEDYKLCFKSVRLFSLLLSNRKVLTLKFTTF